MTDDRATDDAAVDGVATDDTTTDGGRTSERPTARLVAIAVSAVVLLVVGLTVAWVRDDADERSGAAIELARPIEAPDVTLTDTDGDPFDLRTELTGRTTLLYFGYPNCPDACPIHMAVLSGVMGRLPADVASDLRVVFITTDPERDDAASLREYLDRFDADFVGLTGSDDELVEAQIAAGVPVAVREPAGEDGEYLMGHATQVLVFEHDGVARNVYPFGVRQSDWAADLPALVRRGA